MGAVWGDVDNDGRQDPYSSSNLGSNRLYRNLGGFRFEDITERAGVAGPPGWKTGVTMADVNGDGHVDIHVSPVRYQTMDGRNALYVNDGDGTFTDRTTEYGLDFAGFATQAAFLLGLGIEGMVTGVRLASEARQLLMPGEMGEAFKAMALTPNLEEPLSGLSVQDLRHSL